MIDIPEHVRDAVHLRTWLDVRALVRGAGSRPLWGQLIHRRACPVTPSTYISHDLAAWKVARQRASVSARLTKLPADVVALLDAGRGFFVIGEARAAGVSDDRVQRLVRAGLLQGVARGAYAARAQLEENLWQAHAIRTRAFVSSCRGYALAAGWSAVALRRLPVLRSPPALPVLIRPGPTGRGTSRSRYGIARVADLPVEHRGQHAGCPTVSSAWMAADLARAAPRPDALVLADAVLRSGVNRDRLLRAIDALHGMPGVERARWIARNADGGAETALETLGRLSCLEGGLPVPLSNVWIGDGYPLYRLDHLWPYHWVAAEGDGALKYRGQDPAAVVKAEKEREWALRRLGLEVVRYDWGLAAYRRALLAGRFAAVLQANPARPHPVPWWPTASPWIMPDGQLRA